MAPPTGPRLARLVALAERTGVPCHQFDHLMGLAAVDGLVQLLHRLSGEAVPARLERQRAQLQDAMLDCHFMLGMGRFAVAGIRAGAERQFNVSETPDKVAVDAEYRRPLLVNCSLPAGMEALR